MVQKVAEKVDEIEPPERLWVQLYGDTPLSTVSVNAYRNDPREVHDNSKPVYQYILVDALNTRQRAERAARRWFEEVGLYPCSNIDHKRLADVIVEEFNK